MIRKIKWPEIFPDKSNNQFFGDNHWNRGVSNSGKSKLAKLIKSNLPEKVVAIICQDDFVRPQYEIPIIKGHIDWELTESINFLAFKKAIIEASEASDIVIAEGFLAFYNPGINKLYDKKLFIEISKDIFLERKRKDLRWGEEPEWYIDHIWQTYQRIGKIKLQKNEYVIVNGST